MRAGEAATVICTITEMMKERWFECLLYENYITFFSFFGNSHWETLRKESFRRELGNKDA